MDVDQELGVRCLMVHLLYVITFFSKVPLLALFCVKSKVFICLEITSVTKTLFIFKVLQR